MRIIEEKYKEALKTIRYYELQKRMDKIIKFYNPVQKIEWWVHKANCTLKKCKYDNKGCPVLIGLIASQNDKK